MAEEVPTKVFCANGCKMTAAEKKSAFSRRLHPSLCPNKPPKWEAIREERLRREQQEAAAAGGGGLGVVSDEGVCAVVAVKMCKRARRNAVRAFESKEPVEKRPVDFTGDDDVIALGSGVSKKKALKEKN